MHGNNKSAAELRMAFEAGIGCIVVDSLDEIARADCARRPRPGRPDPADPRDHAVDPLLRPDRPDRLEVRLRDRGRAGRARPSPRSPRSRHLELAGFHAHLGSQIFELEPYARAIELMAEFCRPHRPRVMNVGGGLGIAYSAGRPAAVDRGLRRPQGRRASRGCFDPMPKILLEPGPLARRQRRRHRSTRSAPSRRSRASAPTSPSTAACPTTCGRCSTAPATRR